ncbi:integrase core domain protein [Lasius niger]|uniref:Integrase core domain protein n=1 Tax=Lasius niger TaxID=67767 RepID=A0A0J7KUM7_LASNI|nr:integrase core domain protein [Lasius niger]
MRQPTGYNDEINRVCKLKRSLYGLKQASRSWSRRFTDSLNKFQLRATEADSCVFTSEEGESRLILAIYINDGLIAAAEENRINSLLQELRKEFEITTNVADIFLGLQIEQQANGAIFLHQEAYTNRVLERFRMETANPVAIPADKQHETHETITYAVNKASQFLEQPTKTHWNAFKRILKYRKGTPYHGLYYKSGSDTKILAYSDADYAGDTETRRSTTGYVLKLGPSTIIWSSQRQKIVALSTTEVEYIAACQAVKELT